MRYIDKSCEYGKGIIKGEIVHMYLKVKRLMDIILSFLGIIILSPVFLILT